MQSERGNQRAKNAGFSNGWDEKGNTAEMVNSEESIKTFHERNFLAPLRHQTIFNDYLGRTFVISGGHSASP